MKLGIRGKIIGSFEVSIVLVLTVAIVVSYFVLVNVFKQQTFDKLQSISVLKESFLNEFMQNAVSEIEYFNDQKAVRLSTLNFLTSGDTTSKKSIDNQVQSLLKYKTEFSGILILDKGGVVVFSTQKMEEGMIKSQDSYFVHGLEKTFVQDYFFNVSDEKPRMVVSTPIKDDNGDVVGVMVGEINVDSIGALMSNRLGLGKTGETFLVNSYNMVVNDLLKIPGQALKKTIFLPQITNCLRGRSENDSVPDYNGDHVFGYYRWFPQLNSCLVTKIDESEVMQPAYRILFVIGLIFVAGGVLASVVGLMVARHVIVPITKLNKALEKIKAGDYSAQSEVVTDDEIGEMAASFDEMASKLKSSYSDLEALVEEKTRGLNEKVDDLEKLNRLMVGRELKMMELKKELTDKNNQ